MPLLGIETALSWPKKLNLVSKQFEGNACRRLLKEAYRLADTDILVDITLVEMIPFIQTLKTINKLVDASFTCGQLYNKWQEHVNELKRVYPATGLS